MWGVVLLYCVAALDECGDDDLCDDPHDVPFAPPPSVHHMSPLPPSVHHTSPLPPSVHHTSPPSSVMSPPPSLRFSPPSGAHDDEDVSYAWAFVLLGILLGALLLGVGCARRDQAVRVWRRGRETLRKWRTPGPRAQVSAIEVRGRTITTVGARRRHRNSAPTHRPNNAPQRPARRVRSAVLYRSAV